MRLIDSDNAPGILFRQAALPEHRDQPRLMYRQPAGWATISWRQYSTRVQRLGSFLIDRGVGKGVKVAVLSATRQEWAVAGLAVLAAGGTLVPVDPGLSGPALQHVLAHSDSELLFVENARLLQQALDPVPPPALRQVVSFEALPAPSPSWKLSSCQLDRAELEGAQALEQRPYRILERSDALRLDDIGYLVYTGGTSAAAKGVPLTHHNLGAAGAAWIDVNGPLCHHGDIDLLWLPLSNLFGWGELCLGNYLGFVSYLCEPASLLQGLRELRPHILMSRAAAWEQLAAQARAAAPGRAEQVTALKRLTGGRLYFCLSGGPGLSRHTKELFLEADLLLCEGYGLTECAPTVTMNRYNGFDFDSVGRPVPGVQLKIGEDGEILVKGPNVFAGYYKDDRATRQAFDAEGWFHTGDLGRLNQAGFLQLLGRKPAREGIPSDG